MQDIKISPSLMCMDLLNIEKQIRILDRYSYSYHVDIIDGVYFRNFSFTPPFMKAISRVTKRRLDAHLMLVDPFIYLEEMVESGAGLVSIHSEQLVNEAFRTADYLHERNVGFGVVVSPATPAGMIEPYIEELDKITVMTEEPGFAGGRFIPKTLEKIREFVRIREEKGLDYLIEVDGVVNRDHFREYKDAGVDIFILGSRGLFSLSDDLDEAAKTAIQDIENA